MTAFAIIEAVPLRSALIEEAVAIAKGGKSKRSAAISICDRYYGSKFVEDDKVRRDSRVHDLLKIIRKRIVQAE